MGHFDILFYEDIFKSCVLFFYRIIWFSYHINSVLLHCKLSPNLVACNNNKHLLSHSFCGLGTREWLGWVVLAWMWSALWRSFLRWLIPVRGCGWEATVPCHWVFVRVPQWRLPLQRVVCERERRVDGRWLFHDSLEVGELLFVRRDSLKSPAYTYRKGVGLHFLERMSVRDLNVFPNTTFDTR